MKLPKSPENEMRVIDPESTGRILLAAADASKEEQIPFHMFGPILIALGEQMRQRHAQNMRDRGATRAEVDAYLKQTRCEFIKL